MNKDILKGKWQEMKGEIEERWGNSLITILSRSKEEARSSRGSYRRNMDIFGTKPSWNMKIVLNWQKLSAA